MLNYASLEAVSAARTDDHLSVPLYDSYNFAHIPSLVKFLTSGTPTAMPRSVLGSYGRPRNVVLLLVDGFGWTFFERFRNRLPFLRRAVDQGVASKLTTQFPSTTAVHVTTIHTGAPVGESGVFEWYYYEPALDAIFSPLRCYKIGPENLEPVHPADEPLYPTTTLYEALAEQGVTSYCYQSNRYANSYFSQAATRGAHVVPFRTVPEAIVHLVDRVAASSRPTYHFLYVDSVDSISHEYGPDSKFLNAEITGLFGMFEHGLATGLAGMDALVLLTADHGHIAVSGTRTVYVDDLAPEIAGMLMTDRTGRALVPAGSPRDMFLYVRPEHTDQAHALLTARLEGHATVHKSADLIDAGYFGTVHERLRARLSSLVVLPRPHNMVWWRDGGRFTVDKLGYHGGLSRDELEIPLLVWHP